MDEWQLWDDRKGEVVDSGTEDQMKYRYMIELEKGDIAEMDLFVEAPDGTQYAYNRNVTPPRWDEI